MEKNSQTTIVNKYRVPFILFGVIPPLISFFIFYVYPNFSAFFMAFTNRHGVASFENFIRFFNEFSTPTADLRIGFKNTLLTFGILVLTYPFKVLVSYFIYKKVPFSGFYRVVFFMPTIVFSVALNIIFQHMIGPDSPIAEWVQKWMGLDYTPELLSEWRFANKVVLLQMMWLSFAGDLIVWGGTFARIPEEVLEAGYIEGTSWWTEFTRIIVPMVWPTVSLQMVLMFCSIFSATGNVFLLTKGDYGTMTLSAWMYRFMIENSGAKYSSNAFNYLSAVGLVFTTIAITISVFIRKLTDKVFQDVEF